MHTKYSFTKRSEISPKRIEEKHLANAGKVSSLNVSESGGGELRSIPRLSTHESNSPEKNEAFQTMDVLRPVFSTIKEEVRDKISTTRLKKRNKKIKQLDKEEKTIKKKPKVETIFHRPKTAKLKKSVISKKVIKQSERRHSIEFIRQKQRNKAEIKDFMAKRQKEIKQKQSKMFKETEKKQQRIVKNLQKLAKKSKNLLSHISNSKSTLNIHKANETEGSNLGLTMTKNHSILRTSSKVLLSGTKLAKTQRKPKMKKIKAKIDSPSKILSSDSEFDEMSPKRFLDY